MHVVSGDKGRWMDVEMEVDQGERKRERRKLQLLTSEEAEEDDTGLNDDRILLPAIVGRCRI